MSAGRLRQIADDLVYIGESYNLRVPIEAAEELREIAAALDEEDDE